MRCLVPVFMLGLVALATSPEPNSAPQDSRPATKPTKGVAKAAALNVVDRPIAAKCFGERKKGAVVDTIVLHFSSDVMANPANPYDLERNVAIFEKAGVSAHYIVDRDGKVHRLVPEAGRAFHAGKGKLPTEPTHENTLNDHSIGIEILAIGSQKDMAGYMSAEKYGALDRKHLGFTAAQYAALSLLIDDIRSRHPEIKRDRKRIVGHDEYAPGRKTDPGELFEWKQIGLTRER